MPQIDCTVRNDQYITLIEYIFTANSTIMTRAVARTLIGGGGGGVYSYIQVLLN